MAMRQLPPWVGQSRGTGIGSLALLDPVESDDSGSFLEKLQSRLVNILGESSAAVLGFMFVLGALVSLASAGASISPFFGAVLVLMALAWFAVCAVAAFMVHSRDDYAPLWARSLVMALVIIGKVVAIVFLVVSVIVILYMVLAIIVAGSDR